MATIREGVDDLAQLVSNTKRTYHLSEGTVLRIVDMTIALAQQAGAFEPKGADAGEPLPMPETDTELADLLGIESTDEAGTEQFRFEINAEGTVVNPEPEVTTETTEATDGSPE